MPPPQQQPPLCQTVDNTATQHGRRPTATAAPEAIVALTFPSTATSTNPVRSSSNSLRIRGRGAFEEARRSSSPPMSDPTSNLSGSRARWRCPPTSGLVIRRRRFRLDVGRDPDTGGGRRALGGARRGAQVPAAARGVIVDEPNSGPRLRASSSATTI